MTVLCLLPILFVLFTLLSQKKDSRTEDMAFMSRAYTNILRAIAIMIIMLCHASHDVGHREYTPLGGIGVAIFLILSGYGITESYMKSGLAHYWRKKVARIWLPYMLLLLTVTLLKGNASRMLSAEFVLDLLCMRTSYWFISFLVYNYILFYISHRIGALRKYKYAPFAVFAVVIYLMGREEEAEQCFSFVTGVWIAYNMEKAKKILLNPHTLAALLLTSVVFLGLKQVPQVREVAENNPYLYNSIGLLIKYTFALFTISLFTPPHTQHSHYQRLIIATRNKLAGSAFIAFCSAASLELYLVHFSLRFIIDKDHQFVSLTIFLIMTFGISYVYNRINKQIARWIK